MPHVHAPGLVLRLDPLTLAKNGAVFVKDGNGHLLLDRNAQLAQPVRQRVFIDFLQMTGPVVFLSREGGFTNDIAQLENGVFGWLVHKDAF